MAIRPQKSRNGCFNEPMVAPALLIGFNRPRRILESLKRIEAAGVKEIFIHLDGPRVESPSDHELTQKVFEVALEFRNKFDVFEITRSPLNLGCGPGVVSAIDWFFKQNQKGLIVEDDIIITKNFVTFATEALDKFENSENIWHINGWLPINKAPNRNAFGTRYALPWGWATWAKKWEFNSKSVSFIEGNLPSKLQSNLDLGSSTQFDFFWLRNFALADENPRAIWDYQWIRRMWSHGGIAISPPFRMTANTGFSSDSTHTYRPSRKQISRFEVSGTWEFPPKIEIGPQDLLVGELTFSNKSANSIFASTRLNMKVNSTQIPNRLIRFIKIFSMRELASEWFSLLGIKTTLLNVGRTLLKW